MSRHFPQIFRPGRPDEPKRVAFVLASQGDQVFARLDAPGAHIRVQVRLPDGSSAWRHYSLIDLGGAAGTPGFAPRCYTIAVRRAVAVPQAASKVMRSQQVREKVIRRVREARVERGLCLVPERRELFGDLSVLDNLRLGAYSRGLRPDVLRCWLEVGVAGISPAR